MSCLALTYQKINFLAFNIDNAQGGEEIERQFQKIKSPLPNVGLFRLSGAFPTFSSDGKRVAFVDNEFKSVWVADEKGLRIVFEVLTHNLIYACMSI